MTATISRRTIFRQTRVLLVGAVVGLAFLLLGSPALAQSVGGDGGASVGTGSSGGGSGGNSTVVATPTAVSGSTGEANAGSSSTNTGNTGPAESQAFAAPVASSGNSGTTGSSGPVSSNPTAINTAPLGSATATGGGAVSGSSGQSATVAEVPAGAGAVVLPSSPSVGGLTGVELGTPAAAGSSLPAAQSEANTSGSFINFSRSLGSAGGASGSMTIALFGLAAAMAVAVSVASTRVGRRLAMLSSRRGPTCLA